MPLDTDVLEHLIQTVRRFVRKRLIPLESQVEEEDDVPQEIIEEMQALGLFGLTIPVEYGGLGLKMFDVLQVLLELGYASPAFRSVIGTNIGIGSQGILIDGTDQQKLEWLPRLASGELISAFALTEPDTGSDAAAIACKATRDGDSYIISGTKRYITNALRAGVFTLMARTGTPEERATGISAFIVDASLPGISFGLKDTKMGQRGTTTCDIFFDQVRVPADCLIGLKEGQGFKTALKVLHLGRLQISAVAVGNAHRLIDESVSYASERKQFGQLIGEFQIIQAMLADSYTEFLASHSLLIQAARQYDNGVRDIKTVSACKLFCTEMVGRIADRAVQIHGGAGYMSRYAVERFYRDVRLFRIYEGTSQIQQIAIAKELMKEMKESGHLDLPL